MCHNLVLCSLESGVFLIIENVKEREKRKKELTDGGVLGKLRQPLP